MRSVQDVAQRRRLALARCTRVGSYLAGRTASERALPAAVWISAYTVLSGSLEPGQQLVGPDLQGSNQPQESRQADLPLAALDAAHLNRREARRVREMLLSPAASDTRRTKIRPEALKHALHLAGCSAQRAN